MVRISAYHRGLYALEDARMLPNGETSLHPPARSDQATRRLGAGSADGAIARPDPPHPDAHCGTPFWPRPGHTTPSRCSMGPDTIAWKRLCVTHIRARISEEVVGTAGRIGASVGGMRRVGAESGAVRFAPPASQR